MGQLFCRARRVCRRGCKPVRATGLFVTLEGPEGSGKSTQARKIVEYLRRKGYGVVHTREPGGTSLGEQIRKLLLDPAHRAVTPKTEFLLYEAVRSQHVEEVICKALERGKIVVCERFSDASIAYQGYGRGLPLVDLERIDRFATSTLRPAITFLFDLSARVGLAKAMKTKNEFSSKGDRIEQAGISFHNRVRRGYHLLARRHSKRIHMVPILPKSTPEETFVKVQMIIDAKLKKEHFSANRAQG